MIKKLISLFILIILLSGFYSNWTFAEDKKQQIINLIKRMKSSYVKADKSLLNISWLPKNDVNCKTNHTVCRSNIGQKIEAIGKLGCIDVTKIKYTISKGSTNIIPVYSVMTCDLQRLIIETTSNNPKRYYVYKPNYPKAELEKIVITYPDGPMMSFKPDGKVDNIVYDNLSSCMQQNDAGQLVDSPNTRDLCRKQIMYAIPEREYTKPK